MGVCTAKRREENSTIHVSGRESLRNDKVSINPLWVRVHMSGM